MTFSLITPQMNQFVRILTLIYIASHDLIHILNLDFEFFGVQNGDECYCGNSDSKFIPAPSSQCNKPCHGDSHQTCGSSWRLNAYERLSFNKEDSFIAGASCQSVKNKYHRQCPNGRTTFECKSLYEKCSAACLQNKCPK